MSLEDKFNKDYKEVYECLMSKRRQIKGLRLQEEYKTNTIKQMMKWQLNYMSI